MQPDGHMTAALYPFAFFRAAAFAVRAFAAARLALVARAERSAAVIDAVLSKNPIHAATARPKAP
jgi:hypothetical protein